jgi:hypothetical protein
MTNDQLSIINYQRGLMTVKIWSELRLKFWSLFIGYWSLVIGYWSLFIGHWSLKMVLALLIAGLSLSFIPFTPTAAAQTINILPNSETTPIPHACLQLVSLRLPHCQSKLILLSLKRWVTMHVVWDTRRWAMPLYIEFDQTDRWRRATLLCVHFNRSAP